MCGIAGVLSTGAPGQIRVPDLSHRGPDSAGAWADECVRLWHWRLRVVDLSDAGNQPFVAANGRQALLYNGEIYNAPQLRRALEAEGAEFRSRTDTEVVLHAAIRHGGEGIEALRGMYAFALWDADRHRLLLARDPAGIKPLYLYSRDGRVAFASELPALLELIGETPAPDFAALWHFFTYGFVPAPLTAFRHITKVMPGEVLEFDAFATRQRVRRMPRPWLQRTPAHRQAPLTLKDAIVDAVREQFAADVPVGVFLSGGIDSNVLVAAARLAGLDRIHTFTVAFDDRVEGASYDEIDAARASARFFSTEHQEIGVTLKNPDELLDSLHGFGEPFSNPTVLLTREMSRAARNSVTVALSGAGGDEIFGGYPRYRAMRHRRVLSGPVGRQAAAVATIATSVMRQRTPRALRRISWLADADGDASDCYLRWTYYLGEQEKRHLLPGLLPAASDSGAFLYQDVETDSLPDPTGQLSDLAVFLPNNILAYTDIGSMAVSLETRVPFLDPDVAYLGLRAAFAATAFATPKGALRSAFERDLPPHVLRGRKRGFNPPLGRWIRGPLDPLFDSEVTRAFRADIVDERALAELRLAHRRGVEDYSHELLSLLVAATWYARWC